MSRKVMAPSRGMLQPALNPQRALHLGGRCLNVSPLSGFCSLQKQLGCKILMRSRLAPRPQQTDKTGRVFQRRQLDARPAGWRNPARERELEIRCVRHAGIVADTRRRFEAPTYRFPRGLGSAS